VALGQPYPGDIGPQETDEDSGVYYDEILRVRAPRAETREAWALRGVAPICACGCGGKIEIIPVHRTKGLPKYIHGHHPNPLRRGFEALREQGYKLVCDVAAELGVSATTLRRVEVEGVIPTAKRITYARGKEARVYTDSQVKAMVRSKVRGGSQSTRGGGCRRRDFTARPEGPNRRACRCRSEPLRAVRRGATS
jgi:hypothetical protein